MQERAADATLRPGDLLRYEDWSTERGKSMLVLSTTSRRVTCIASGGAAVVELPRALCNATKMISGACPKKNAAERA